MPSRSRALRRPDPSPMEIAIPSSIETSGRRFMPRRRLGNFIDHFSSQRRARPWRSGWMSSWNSAGVWPINGCIGPVISSSTVNFAPMDARMSSGRACSAGSASAMLRARLVARCSIRSSVSMAVPTPTTRPLWRRITQQANVLSTPGTCLGTGCIRQGEVGDPAPHGVPGLHGLLDFLEVRNQPFAPMESTPRRHASRTMMESGCSDHAGCSACLGPRSRRRGVISIQCRGFVLAWWASFVHVQCVGGHHANRLQERN